MARMRSLWMTTMAVFSALVLTLGVLPCEVQAMTADCEATMGGMPDHGDEDGSSSKQIDCAIGCRLAPPLAPALVAPTAVRYAVHYTDKPQSEEGLTPDPAVPPPRGLV